MSARVFRFYIVVDTSASMDMVSRHGEPTPYSRLKEAVPSLLLALRKKPDLIGRTYVSVTTFNQTAQVLLPSVSTTDFKRLDAFTSAGTTDYAQTFTALYAQIKNDDAELPIQKGHHWWKPCVFFLSDGEPELADGVRQPADVWKPIRDQMVSELDANIVALGFGQISDETLANVATRVNGSGPVLAFADNGVKRAGDLINSIATAILRTATRSAKTGVFDCPIPDGMRRVHVSND